MNKFLLTATFVCLGFTFCSEIRGEDKFNKNNMTTAILDITQMRSDEKLNSSERIVIREKSITVIKHELAILFSLIKASSDVELLADIVKNDDLFPFCIDLIIEEQDKCDDTLSNKIANYIVYNGSNNSTINYINKIIMLNWELNRYPESVQIFIVNNIQKNKIKFYAYFALSDNMKAQLQKYIQEQSKKLLIGERSKATHAIPLFASILLASEGDINAIDRLSVLIDKIDVNNNFDLFYVIIGSVITKQQKLLNKVALIMKDDPREKFFGYDCIPQKISLQHEAAASFSVIDEKFPSTSFWAEVDKSHIKECVLWLEKNNLNINYNNKTLIKKISATRLNDL